VVALVFLDEVFAGPQGKAIWKTLATAVPERLQTRYAWESLNVSKCVRRLVKQLRRIWRGPRLLLEFEAQTSIIVRPVL
jgi:hypothetical protein